MASSSQAIADRSELLTLHRGSKVASSSPGLQVYSAHRDRGRGSESDEKEWVQILGRLSVGLLMFNQALIASLLCIVVGSEDFPGESALSSA